MLLRRFGLGLILITFQLSSPAFGWDYDEEVKNLPCSPDCSLEEELAASEFMSFWQEPFSAEVQAQEYKGPETFNASALYNKLARSARSVRNFPYQALNTQVRFFTTNAGHIKNKRYLVLIDFRQPSTVKRMHVFDTNSGALRSFYTAHGEKSGTLYATRFSNNEGSHQSTLGFLVTGSTYYGENGKSLNIHGLESRNSRTFERRIVFHKSNYVSAAYINKYGMLGRSWGCPAVEVAHHYLIDELKGGVLVYKYR